MRNFFSIDNPVFVFLGKLFDLIVLNIIWLLLCIPLVTIVPATTAMYYTIVKVIRKERSYLLKEFFNSFKMNIKQGVIIDIIALVIAYVLYIDFSYSYNLLLSGDENGSVWFIVFLLITYVAVSTLLYSIAFLSRFVLKISQNMRLALYAALKHAGQTLLFMLIILAVVFLVWLTGGMAIIFLPSIALFGISFLMERILRKYTPVPSEEESEGKDLWYLE